MNKLNKLLALGLLSAPGMLFAQEKEFTIKGKVPADSKILKVFFLNSHQMDSVKVVNGAFEYHSIVKIPISTILVRDMTGKGFRAAVNSGSAVVFYEEPGEIYMDLPETGEFAHVTGGKTNTELQTYNKQEADIYQQSVDVLTQLQATEDAVKGKALNAKRRELFIRKNSLTLKFAKEHPDSYVSLDKAFLVARMEIPAEVVKQCESVYKSFTTELKQSETGIAFGKLLDSKMGTVIGGEATDFTVVDSLNHDISLKSFRGRYVLLDFWASWCGPCRAENPNILKAFEKYKNKNFTVLAVSLDKTNARDKWLKAVKNDHLTYTQVWDPEGKVAKQYLVNSIPHNFLLGPDGKIIGTNLTGENLQNKLKQLLNK